MPPNEQGSTRRTALLGYCACASVLPSIVTRASASHCAIAGPLSGRSCGAPSGLRFGCGQEHIGWHTEARAQPLDHRHAQSLLAAKNLADAARRTQDWDHVRARKPVLIHKVTNYIGGACWPARPLALLIGSDQARLRRETRDVGGLAGSHQLIDQSTRARKLRVAVNHDQGRIH